MGVTVLLNRILTIALVVEVSGFRADQAPSHCRDRGASVWEPKRVL